MARFAAMMIGVAALIAAAPTFAQVTAYAPGQGAISRLSVNIEVRAAVRDRCGFASGGAPSGRIDKADFDLSGFSHDFAISLNCTGASRIAVSSGKGGLLAEGAAAPGYATLAPYQVSLQMVGDNGTQASASCSAQSLSANGACSFGGTAGPTNGLRLPAASTRSNGSYLRVSAPAYSGTEPLVAGKYADTLTVTVGIAP